VLWRYWLGSRKGIRPVKNWVVGYWRGYLPAARYRLAFGPADATAAHCLLLHASVISRSVLPFWYRLTQLVPDKGVLNGCVWVCVILVQPDPGGQRRLPDILHANTSSLHHINQSSRCGYKQVTAASQVTDLSTDVRPTIHHARAYVWTVGKLHTARHIK